MSVERMKYWSCFCEDTLVWVQCGGAQGHVEQMVSITSSWQQYRKLVEEVVSHFL